MKLWNRIKYGASNTPKYITKQRRWLYKGHWVSTLEAISHYTNEVQKADLKEIGYTYKLNGKIYQKDDFNELLALMLVHPEICIVDYFQFTPIQLALIQAIQKYHYTTIINNYNKRYQEFMEDYKRITQKLGD